ncbi:MAG: winged helix DNA-binding domain-containing protein, partial [Acidimicrobiia bacterium]|nr:winged helix DNA-binding domain-containing protein [Acidimicrobiia bacterium]
MLTPRQLNRTTLRRQALHGRRDATVGEITAQMLVIQSQEPAAPYLALWNRLASFDPDDGDDAWRSGEL